jgi:hypothetical protein
MLISAWILLNAAPHIRAHEPPNMIYARNKDIITGKVANEWQGFLHP